MKYLKMVVAAAAALIALSACQDVFTTSVFENVYQLDYSTMSSDQKVSYAEDLLATGSAEELAAAYTEISALLPDDLSTADPDLVVLAAELAIGSSGVGDAVTDALEIFTSGEEVDTEAAITGIIESINTDNLSDAVALIEAAEDMEGVTLTSEQYTNAAAAQLLVVLDEVEALGVADPSSLDSNVPAQAAVIEDLEQALAWAEAGGLDASLFGDGIALP